MGNLKTILFFFLMILFLQVNLYSEEYSKMTKEQLLKSKKSYESLIIEHKEKLEDYKKNPDAYDNKGFLKEAGSNKERRDKIIQGRIKELNDQIMKQKNELEKIEDELDKRK